MTKPTVEDCAVACDELTSCMSFEYQMGTCNLSSSCSYSLTGPSSNDWNYFVSRKTADQMPLLLFLSLIPFAAQILSQVKVPEGLASHDNPEGNSYLWLLKNAAETSPIELALASSVQLPMASYYIG